MKQQTVEGSVRIEGVAPHKGTPSSITINEASIDTGIIFRLHGREVPALSDFIRNGEVKTTSLSLNGLRIDCVEHLLAAISALKIDNAYIDLDGMEPPIINGTAQDYYIPLCNRVKEQAVDVKLHRIKEFFVVQKPPSWAIFYPLDTDELVVEADIEFPHPIGRQFYRYSGTNFLTELSWARSFLRSPVSQVWEDGKTTWDKAREVLPILSEKPRSNDKILYFDGGRWLVTPTREDEPVRHKVMDFIGDFSLVGKRICGGVRIHWPGHHFNCFVAQEFSKHLPVE